MARETPLKQFRVPSSEFRVSDPTTRNPEPGTLTITDTVRAVTLKAILLQQFAKPSYAKHQQQWIAKSQIVECDQDLDEIEEGDEITIEIPKWLFEKIENG